MPPQPAKDTYIIYILKIYILKLGQLIEYKLWDVFLENTHTECNEETIRKPFSEKQNKTEHIAQSVV